MRNRAGNDAELVLQESPLLPVFVIAVRPQVLDGRPSHPQEDPLRCRGHQRPGGTRHLPWQARDRFREAEECRLPQQRYRSSPPCQVLVDWMPVNYWLESNFRIFNDRIRLFTVINKVEQLARFFSSVTDDNDSMYEFFHRRFLFLLLGPDDNVLDYHEIGRSLSTLMADGVIFIYYWYNLLHKIKVIFTILSLMTLNSTAYVLIFIYYWYNLLHKIKVICTSLSLMKLNSTAYVLRHCLQSAHSALPWCCLCGNQPVRHLGLSQRIPQWLHRPATWRVGQEDPPPHRQHHQGETEGEG